MTRKERFVDALRLIDTMSAAELRQVGDALRVRRGELNSEVAKAPKPLPQVGQLIWLTELEDQPRQRARVLDVKRGVVMVEILKKYRDGADDDGLREVPENQIEG